MIMNTNVIQFGNVKPSVNKSDIYIDLPTYGTYFITTQ